VDTMDGGCYQQSIATRQNGVAKVGRRSNSLFLHPQQAILTASATLSKVVFLTKSSRHCKGQLTGTWGGLACSFSVEKESWTLAW